MASYSISEIYGRHPDLVDLLDMLRHSNVNISWLYTKGNKSGQPYIYFNRPGCDEEQHVRISKRKDGYSVIFKLGTGVGVRTERVTEVLIYESLSHLIKSSELREYLNI